jgi:hypothetical protein
VAGLRRTRKTHDESRSQHQHGHGNRYFAMPTILRKSFFSITSSMNAATALRESENPIGGAVLSRLLYLVYFS